MPRFWGMGVGAFFLFAPASPAQLSIPQASDSTLIMLENDRRFQPIAVWSAGYALAGTPQIGAHYAYARGWQAGLELRSWAMNASAAQDYWPEIGLHIRRFWLAAEESDALKNSEYIDFGFGIFPAYSFGITDFDVSPFPFAKRLGYRPLVRAAIGKYWKPFADFPGGLELHLVLGRYLDGHPPEFNHQDLLTLGAHFFWAPQGLAAGKPVR